MGLVLPLSVGLNEDNMSPQLGIPEIFVILLVALVFLGPKRLPDAARKLGEAIREVKRQSEAVKTELRDMPDLEDFREQVSGIRKDLRDAVDMRGVLETPGGLDSAGIASSTVVAGSNEEMETPYARRAEDEKPPGQQESFVSFVSGVAETVMPDVEVVGGAGTVSRRLSVAGLSMPDSVLASPVVSRRFSEDLLNAVRSATANIDPVAGEQHSFDKETDESTEEEAEGSEARSR